MPPPPDLQHHVSLAAHTTLSLGGPARHFAVIDSIEALRTALQWAENRHEVLILGGGSNLVVSDDGFAGLALKLELRGLTFESNGVVQVAAGECWDDLVRACTQRGLAGIECLSGIPGSVGATPIQNVGAYGQEVAEVIESVDVLDTRTGASRTIEAGDCRFAYRDSRFKHEPGRFIVLSVRFRLRPGGPPKLAYRELVRAVGDEPASLSRVRDVVLELRRSKSMVIDPDDPNRRSVGSFFTNPIVSERSAQTVVDRALAAGIVTRPDEVPRYDGGHGRTKLAAAWLIERAGVRKGWRHREVGVSSRHTLALVHHGGGTTVQLLELARMVRDRVHETFEVELRAEPHLVGVQLGS